MLIFGLFFMLVFLAVVAVVAAVVISAVVKAKAAKYSSIQQTSHPVAQQDGVWPPAPTTGTHPAASGDPPETGR